MAYYSIGSIKLKLSRIVTILLVFLIVLSCFSPLVSTVKADLYNQIPLWINEVEEATIADKQTEDNEKEMDTTELIIGIKNAKQNGYLELKNLANKNHGEIVNTVSINGEITALVVKIPLTKAPSLVMETTASCLSRYIEPNEKFQIQQVPNDSYWNMQWGLQKIEANYAWNTTTGDSSVLVAVVDTGIDWDHPDLSANYVALGYDWVNNDTDPMDDHGHGTHVAGIIAAALNNSVGIAGLAQVKIMAEKGFDISGYGHYDNLANAIIHAVDQGAKIISNSWGGGSPSTLIYDAVKYAYDSGVLVIAAAGNDATNRKLFPAAYDEVIAVTATDSCDNIAEWSNFGEWVELAAPGVDIFSTTWDNAYMNKSGTSMSTPHVTGLAALIWSQFPKMTRDWVRAQLRYTAEDLGNPSFDIYYGYGRINARTAVEQAPADHDLLIFELETIRSYVEPSDIITYNSTILNFGINDESNITVQLFVDGNVVNSSSLHLITSGTSTTVRFSWKATFEGTYNVTVRVEPVLGEGITANNRISAFISVVSLLGDVDVDGDVDLFDLTRLLRAYDTAVGDDLYDPSADFDNDGDVDLLDLYWAMWNYGKAV